MPAERSHTPSLRQQQHHASTPVRSDGIASPRSDTSAPVTPVPVRDDENISCQRCRQRKKRCDRVRPSCEGCIKSKAPCVYEVIITDRAHPQYVPNLLAEMRKLKDRCKELEQALAQAQSNHSAIPVVPVVQPSIQPVRANTTPTSDLIQRVVVRLLTKEQDAGSSLRGTIGRQLGSIALEEQASVDASDEPSSLWPPLDLARSLVDYFFDLSFGTMRFVHRSVIESDLEAVYGTSSDIPNPRSFTVPDVRIFRLCLLFTAVSERLDDDASTTFRLRPVELYRLAIAHLPAAFKLDQMTCFICINMLCLVSLHQFVTISPYETVSIGAAMALEMGLNKEDPTLPVDVQEERRRVFWTLFCADRAVATYTVKPIAIPETLITIRLPQDDFGGMTTDSDLIPPGKFFRSIVMLRRLHGIMLERIYLADEINDPETLLVQLRNQIDDWYADTIPPAPFATAHPFFEVHYNICLSNLYRPSRLSAQTPALRLPLLRSASARAIALYQDLINRRRIARSYTHLYNIVVLGVSMLYALGEAEGDVKNLDISSWRFKALSDIDTVQGLLARYCTGWPGVDRYREAFAALAASMRVKLARPAHVNVPPAWATPMATTPTDFNPMAGEGRNDIFDSAHGGGDFVFDTGAIDVEAFLSSIGLSEWTSGA